MNDDNRFEKEPAKTLPGRSRRSDRSQVHTYRGTHGKLRLWRECKTHCAVLCEARIPPCGECQSVYNDALTAEVWQLAIWCVCAVLTFYSVAKKSVATLVLNYILFFGVSMIPLWQSAHENLQSIIKLFFG